MGTTGPLPRHDPEESGRVGGRIRTWQGPATGLVANMRSAHEAGHLVIYLPACRAAFSIQFHSVFLTSEHAPLLTRGALIEGIAGRSQIAAPDEFPA